MSDEMPPPPPPPPASPPPPPMPAGGSGMSGGSFSAGEPFTFGWEQFKLAPGPWILLMLIVFAGLVVTAIFGFILIVAVKPSFFLFLLFEAFLWFLLMALYYALSYGLIRSALGATQGKAPNFSEAWNMANFGGYIVTSLLVGLIVGVGFLFCFIPGIIAAFLLVFAPYFVLDQNMAPVDAIKASFDLVKNNVGTVLVFLILNAILLAVASFFCYLPLLVAVPISQIALAWVYRRMTGQSITGSAAPAVPPPPAV